MKRRSAHNIILTKRECRKQFYNLISRDDRIQIHEAYWKLDFKGQNDFIRKYVHSAELRRRRYNTCVEVTKKRAFIVTLPTANHNPVTVCRQFFNTIGFGQHFKYSVLKF